MKTIIIYAVFMCLVISGAIFGGGSQAFAQTHPSRAYANPCADKDAILNSLSGATSGTVATQVIALVAAQRIHICSMSVVGVSGTAPTFSLVRGTGTNCGTGQVVVFTAFGTSAAVTFAYTDTVAILAAGNALCYLSGGTDPVHGFIINYIQQ